MITPSPAKSVLPGAIVFYEQTWREHVRVYHPDVKAEDIRSTISDPCFIHESKTRDDTLVFTNTTCVNDDGDPLWVPVRVTATEDPNFVASAYYKEDGSPGTIVWNRGDE